MSNLTHTILKCSFDVMNELGIGFLETIYKNALCAELKQQGLKVSTEQYFKIYYRDEQVGLYRADLIVENRVIIEAKCCAMLLPEHQAQVINYLKAANISLGLLINFGQRNLDYKRLYHPNVNSPCI